MKIKQFIKKNKVKIIVIGTIVGGAVIGGVIGKKYSGGKTSGNIVRSIKNTELNTEEVIDYILKAGENDKFAIFKESSTYDIITDL